MLNFRCLCGSRDGKWYIGYGTYSNSCDASVCRRTVGHDAAVTSAEDHGCSDFVVVKLLLQVCKYQTYLIVGGVNHGCFPISHGHTVVRTGKPCAKTKALLAQSRKEEDEEDKERKRKRKRKTDKKSRNDPGATAITHSSTASPLKHMMTYPPSHQGVS